MSLQQLDIRLTPGAPMTEVFPHMDFGYVEQVIPAGGFVMVNQGIGGAVATGVEWIIGSTGWLSGEVLSGLASGLVLILQFSMDGIALGYRWRTIWIPGLVPFYIEDLHLPGYNMRLQIFNPDALDQPVQAMFFFKAVL